MLCPDVARVEVRTQYPATLTLSDLYYFARRASLAEPREWLLYRQSSQHIARLQTYMKRIEDIKLSLIWYGIFSLYDGQHGRKISIDNSKLLGY